VNRPAHHAPPAGGTSATERLIARAAPGLPALMRYSFARDFRHDLIAGSFFRPGALADCLSRPVLVGFTNGIAISIFLGQVGKLLGFSVEAGGVIPRLFEIVSKLPGTHMATLAIGLA
jgi:MFS superfamily sulfate permease-like transporter